MPVSPNPDVSVPITIAVDLRPCQLAHSSTDSLDRDSRQPTCCPCLYILADDAYKAEAAVHMPIRMTTYTCSNTVLLYSQLGRTGLVCPTLSQQLLLPLPPAHTLRCHLRQLCSMCAICSPHLTEPMILPIYLCIWISCSNHLLWDLHFVKLDIIPIFTSAGDSCSNSKRMLLSCEPGDHPVSGPLLLFAFFPDGFRPVWFLVPFCVAVTWPSSNDGWPRPFTVFAPL